MNYYQPTSKLTFESLRLMLRKGQLYAFDIESCNYGLNITHRLFVTVITPKKRFENLMVGEACDDKAKLIDNLIQSLSTEPPSLLTHYMTGFPFKALCASGTRVDVYRLINDDKNAEFQSSVMPFPKCLALLKL